MTDKLLSVGVDLGTSTTQMVLSQLTVQNTASPFTVPRMEITSREILYKSAIHFTPLLASDTLDSVAIGNLLRQEYERAGISPGQVQTGAVIITGETARKENARQVLEQISDLAGEFVVATAGPALESVLAARGAGADKLAKERHRPVLHFDIGGGTSNLALYDENGDLADTGCLNIGGRLLKLSPQGEVIYVSPVLEGLDVPKAGERVMPHRLQALLEQMVEVLEQAAGLRPKTKDLDRWVTDRLPRLPDIKPILSFSGGVADLIAGQENNWLAYGDIGVLLGKTIARSALCRQEHVIGAETIRATVVGAGSYATELSGSTVAYTDVSFPMHDIPAVVLTPEQEQLPPEDLAAVIRQQRSVHSGPVALSLEGHVQTYEDLTRLADGIQAGMEGSVPLIVVLEQDVGKALGQAMSRPGIPLICLDGLHVPRGSYLDIAAPAAGGAAVPVVVKTLAFS